MKILGVGKSIFFRDILGFIYNNNDYCKIQIIYKGQGNHTYKIKVDNIHITFNDSYG